MDILQFIYGQANRINSAKLYVEFQLPWIKSSYRKHNVTIIINSDSPDKNVIGTLTNTIPAGLYAFEIPLEYLNLSNDGISYNKITIFTDNPNDGHYIVATDFKVILSLNRYQTTVCASSQEEANQNVTRIPFIGDCTYPQICPRVGSITVLDSNGESKRKYSAGENVILIRHQTLKNSPLETY